jgi:hypothetical protein
MTVGCQLARPSSIIRSRKPVRNSWTMSAVRAIQSQYGQCLQRMKSRGALSQTWRPTVRLHSSARPLPDEQYDYPWHPNGTNHYAQPKKATVILPRTTPKIEPNIEPTPTKATVSLNSDMSSIPEVDLTDPFQAVSPSTLRYTGDAVMPITSKLHIVTPQEDTPRGVWPIFRLMVRPLLLVDCVRLARLSRISNFPFCFDRTKAETFATQLGMEMTMVTFSPAVVSARCHCQMRTSES